MSRKNGLFPMSMNIVPATVRRKTEIHTGVQGRTGTEVQGYRNTPSLTNSGDLSNWYTSTSAANPSFEGKKNGRVRIDQAHGHEEDPNEEKITKKRE